MAIPVPNFESGQSPVLGEGMGSGGDRGQSGGETGETLVAAEPKRLAWTIVGTLGVLAVLYVLLAPPPVKPDPGPLASATAAATSVEVIGPGLLRIPVDSPLQKQLEFRELKMETLTTPQLTVSGSVLARIRPGTEPFEERWQFATSELSTDYSDWLRSKSELEFSLQQFAKTKELVSADVSFLQATVDRLEPLAKSNSLPEKDFRQAQSALLKAQIQGDKDVFTAESAVRTARRNLASYARDLAQAGLDPVVFSRAEDHLVLVAANVPEARVSQVYEHQACEVRFYGYSTQKFPAHVEVLGSTLTSDRRTLRALFDVKDPDDLLKPGMFAEVGLGTDPREALRVPVGALLHIGYQDYVLVRSAADTFRVVPVKLAEVREGLSEVLDGLHAGDVVLSAGAILLKARVQESLEVAPRVGQDPNRTHPFLAGRL